jgi:hypothetical protein
VTPLGPGLVEQLVDDRPVHSPERLPGVGGPTDHHVPGAFWVDEVFARPVLVDPRVGRVCVLAPGPETVVADLGQRRIRGTCEQAGLGRAVDGRGGRDDLDLRRRQLPVA